MGEGRPASSFLGRGFVEKDLLLFRADLVSAAFVWLSSDPGGCILTVFVVSKSWVPDFVIHSVSSQSPTAGYLELLSNGFDSGSPDSFQRFQ